MSLDIYFSHNLQHGLLSTMNTILSMAQANGFPNLECVRGAMIFCKAQCAMYGLSWQGILAELQATGQLDSELIDLLENVSTLNLLSERK